MNSPDSRSQHEQIQEFISELDGFAKTAEEALEEIESDLEGKKSRFSVFSQRMLAIRGTAKQLNLPRIAEIAYLGEEIALKGQTADSRPKVRKCVGSLWDALTTIQHLLHHYDQETSEEEGILLNRLNVTLRAFGGARPTFDEDEIAKLISEREKKS